MNIKRLLGILLFAIVGIFGINTIDVNADDADSLVIHYYRYDETYTDWSVWIWEGDQDGFDVNFDASDSFGVSATIDLSTSYFDGATSVGILIWENGTTKDIQQDRFIDITNPDANGDVHAYFVQGVDYFSYVEADQAGCDQSNPDPTVCAHQFTSGLVNAYFNSDSDIEFISTDSVDASDITIYHNDTVVSFTGFTTGTSGTLELADSVTISDPYTIEIDYGTNVDSQVITVNADYDSTLFADAYHYDGPLGFEYSSTETVFRLWAPISSYVEVNLYTKGHTTSSRSDGVNTPYDTVPMTYTGHGVWEATVTGDLHSVYYTFNVINNNVEVTDIQDPYGLTFGLNGLRSMVVDLDQTDPSGWDTDAGIDGYTNPNEAIIYELHVRDLTSQSAWNGTEAYEGLYMGFTEDDTSYTNSITGVTVSTGLAHLIELGITHVHLLPTYDQDGWNNEADFQFNWGYNPQHFNSPEGGYSTDPYDGVVRVNEYKQMVMALHDNGINVINDVVYNHTASTGNYSFNRIVPDYFYRLNSDGSYSNGTGVGNETASERYMVNKYIVDSVTYWAEEYHIDGFRFDLMAVHDYHTMNDVADAVEAIDADIFVYGEPWGGGTIALDWNLQAGKNNLDNMPLISVFNDQFRNALKGSPDGSDGGYITSGTGIYDIIKGIEGSINWDIGTTSSQSINYVTAHDNLTLYDKLKSVHSASGYTEEIDYEARLANSIVMFSQGIPFLHAGVDFLRTKGGNHNSYDASDQVNQLNWIRKSNYVDSFEYYKGIISIRKEFDSFKMSTRSDIETYLEFLNPDGYGMIGYRLTKNNEDILVYHNGGAYANDITLPSGAWELLSDRDQATLDGLGTFETRYPIEEAETLVFVKGNSEDVIPSPHHTPVITNTLTVAFEGANVRVTSNAMISAYSVDGGDYVTVDVPLTYVNVSGLTIGFHTITIKDIYGTESDPFSITILANDDPLVCDDGYSEVDGECVQDPLVCDDGYEEVDGECQWIVDKVPTCTDGYDLIDGECVKQTGCFSAIRFTSFVIPTLSILGGVTLFAIRKKHS